MGVDETRRDTASHRRALVIRTLDAYLGSPNRYLTRFAARLDQPHLMIAGSDIDGLLSSMMLGSVAPWKVVGLVMPDGSVLMAPGHTDLPQLAARPDIFGVDIFSPLFPTVSNHPCLFGTAPRTRPVWLLQELKEFDNFVLKAAERLGSLNLSIWAGIGARLGAKSPQGFPYKYPLGTAQFLLALLEVVKRPPRFYDRSYLPWLVADCDGGLDSIREYHWNVELWWSALAAAVGPASLSEAVYQLALNQRATQFVDVDLRLRRDYRERADALNPDWNLSSDEPAMISSAARLLRDISGWPDPFVQGAESIASWSRVYPTRNVLYLNALTKQAQDVVATHLACARNSIHMNFSRFFEKGTYLGWMMPTNDSAVEQHLGSAPAADFVRESAPTMSSATLFADSEDN